MSKLRLEMPNEGAVPTHVYIDDREILRVRRVSYEQSVDEVPTATIELTTLDGFETDFADIRVRFTPESIEEAKMILRNGETAEAKDEKMSKKYVYDFSTEVGRLILEKNEIEEKIEKLEVKKAELEREIYAKYPNSGFFEEVRE